MKIIRSQIFFHMSADISLAQKIRPDTVAGSSPSIGAGWLVIMVTMMMGRVNRKLFH